MPADRSVRQIVRVLDPSWLHQALAPHYFHTGRSSALPERKLCMLVMLARGELGSGLTGRYFANGSEVSCEFARDRDGIERLYEICQSYK